MAGVALLTATLIACALLLLLVHLELKASAPPVIYESDDPPVEESELTYKAAVPGSSRSGRTRRRRLLSPPAPPPAMPIVEPICQVTFGRAECMRGGAVVPCPPQVDVVRHDTEALDTGAWVLAPTYTCARSPQHTQRTQHVP